MSNFSSIEGTKLTLNGVTISGFSDDSEALMIDTVEIGAVKYGADGVMTATTTGNKGGKLTVKLMPTSESVKFLNAVATAQQAGIRIVFNGGIVNIDNGASVALSVGVMTNYPPMASLGKGEFGDMTYEFQFQNIISIMEAADFS